MPKIAATHYGKCQGCGRLQKLPNGDLAKHGYEVVSRGYGGYFSGTCRGSGHLPYEQSCDWIKNFIIPELEKRLNNLRALQSHLRIAPQEPKGYFHEYIRHCGYAWREVELSLGEDGRVMYVSHEQKLKWLHPYTGMPRGTDLLPIAAEMNLRYADYLETHDIRRAERALAWQKKRVAEWKYRPEALIPIVGAKEALKRSDKEFLNREASFVDDEAA